MKFLINSVWYKRIRGREYHPTKGLSSIFNLTKWQKKSSPSSGLSTLQHLDDEPTLATTSSVNSLIGAFVRKVSGITPAAYQMPGGRCQRTDVREQRSEDREYGIGKSECGNIWFRPALVRRLQFISTGREEKGVGANTDNLHKAVLGQGFRIIDLG